MGLNDPSTSWRLQLGMKVEGASLQRGIGLGLGAGAGMAVGNTFGRELSGVTRTSISTVPCKKCGVANPESTKFCFELWRQDRDDTSNSMPFLWCLN